MGSITTDQPFISVKGKISSISLESMLMVIKPNKDKRIKVQLTEGTEFVNFYSYKELEKSNRVKVWYKTDGEVNKTVKIEKYPELGC